ncbi:MAG: hypothetical protein M3354_07680, partial [Chloroflexota bacterium]|nr:hypothetical protein [Chloroflexota bacterium]
AGNRRDRARSVTFMDAILVSGSGHDKPRPDAGEADRSTASVTLATLAATPQRAPERIIVHLETERHQRGPLGQLLAFGICLRLHRLEERDCQLTRWG